jgi:hypothetical protein
MKRWIPAPHQSDCQSVSGAIHGVNVGENELVRWAWTILPDGRSVVTGYDIVPFAPAETEEPPKKH